MSDWKVGDKMYSFSTRDLNTGSCYELYGNFEPNDICIDVSDFDPEYFYGDFEYYKTKADAVNAMMLRLKEILER